MSGGTPETYGWVHQALDDLGLRLDLDPAALPAGLLGERHPRLDGLMAASLAMARARLPWVGRPFAQRDPARGLEVEVGAIEGNPYFVSRTVVRSPRALTRGGFVAFALDEAMTQVAAAWDATFVSGAFLHALLRGDGVVPPRDPRLVGRPWTEVAKVMRWTFRVPGLRPRELLSVYVPHADADALTCCYFPVSGAGYPPTAGSVRARLLVPCLDRAEFDGASCTALVHLASAQLAGWVPDRLAQSRLFGRSFFQAAHEEALQLRDLADGTGRSGAALVAAPRLDGTRV